MMPTLLHAVARRADALTPDADLLRRFAHAADHAAFEELVRRHGPLVWAVCRQTLPEPADAEDAFQAVFLALVRSAASIRDGRALPAWLHGVAVRVAARARRQGARRAARDRAAARPEADYSVPDAAWGRLVATVHEEVQKLPEAERTAFVLCELQGVSQPDAAARLGCPLGSVSGRLCKARQRLLERLTARGIAPAAVVGVGLTAGAAGALPGRLFDAVRTFPGPSVTASSAVAALARTVTEGVTMRVKLTAAAAVVVAALGITGGAVVLSKAEAQSPDVVKEVKDLVGAAQPPGGGPPPGPGGGFGVPPGVGGAGMPPGGAAGGFGGPPGMGGFGGAGGGFTAAPPTWEYKFVDGKNDRKEFEKVIVQHGKEGWEYCGSERFPPGELVLVFKKRTGGAAAGGFGGAGGGFGARLDTDGGKQGGNAGLWGNWGGRDGVEVRSFTLKNAAAADVVAALNKTLAKQIKAAVAEGQTNRVLVVADAAAMKDVLKLVEELEAKPGKGPGPNAPMGGAGGPPPGAPVGGGAAGFGPPPGVPPRGAAALNVFALKNARAEDLVKVLKPLFPNADMSADPRTNSIVARADEKSLEEMRTLIARLEAADAAKPR